ncbi:hypothetical protein [Acrocarpospora sp. B8E8]|uniref:hypothetical protein n=1 Tax=Acrocarpospora sp. B8E8 TaxID=3153572 RepID=UPI00325F2A60
MTSETQTEGTEYHWIISYLVPSACGHGFRTSMHNGVVTLTTESREDAFQQVLRQVIEAEGIGADEFCTLAFTLEPNRLAA